MSDGSDKLSEFEKRIQKLQILMKMYGNMPIRDYFCWWVQDGEFCNSPLVQEFNQMGYYCNRGHRTSDRDIMGRIQKERVEK